MTQSSRSDGTWHGSWEHRISDAVRALGYSDLSAFSRAHPTDTFAGLAYRLGDNVAPIQVEQVLREYYLSEGRMASFALDSIVRAMHEYLPNGWGRDERSLVLAAQAFGAWSGGLGEAFDDQADAVWDRIESFAIPVGWLPSGTDDPILKRAFNGIAFSS